VSYSDLQTFLRDMESEGDLIRITAEVDPELEITEIATRAVKERMPILFFENVRGARYPLAINILATEKRIERALGMHPEEFGEDLVSFVEQANSPSLRNLWRNRKTGFRMLNIRPKKVRRPAVQQVVEDTPDLGHMPILKCWPDDGGRFITLPLVTSRDPITGKGNMGIYRMHVYDGRTTGMHMQITKGGGYHYQIAEKFGRDLPMAVALGGDPALLLAAVMPLPEGIDEVAFSGILRNKRTGIARAKSIDLPVPANAEFIIEGVVPAYERRREGPFGDHFGHYSDAHDFPVFHVRAITHRKNPVYPATVVGRPPQEDRYLGDAAQQALNPLMRLIHPEVKDLWAYYESGFHHLLVVAVSSRYTREHIKTALGMLGQGQLALTKAIILVNDDVKVNDPAAVLAAIRRNFDTPEDFQLIARAPGDTLDFTTVKRHHGSKMIIDATGGDPPLGGPTAMPADLRAIAPDAMKWRLVGQTLLAVQVKRGGDARGTLTRLVKSPLLSKIKIISIVSDDVNIEDDVDLIWGIFTRFDPAQDLVFTEMKMRGAIPVYEGVMGIDASFKDGYPEPLTMPQEIIEKVDSRWNEYFQ